MNENENIKHGAVLQIQYVFRKTSDSDCLAKLKLIYEFYIINVIGGIPIEYKFFKLKQTCFTLSKFRLLKRMS